MIHLRCAPMLLLVGVISAGCPHRNETKPDAASPVGSTGSALEGEARQDGEGASGPEVTGDAGAALTSADGGPAGGANEEACVDQWLESRGLDRYGSPKGTMYMGGTPLFDERTGERTDRLQFVYGRHAEARSACRPDGGIPGGPAAQ